MVFVWYPRVEHLFLGCRHRVMRANPPCPVSSAILYMDSRPENEEMLSAQNACLFDVLLVIPGVGPVFKYVTGLAIQVLAYGVKGRQAHTLDLAGLD